MHIDILRSVASVDFDVIQTYGRIFEKAVGNISDEWKNVKCYNSKAKQANGLKVLNKKGDLVLFKASRKVLWRQ